MAHHLQITLKYLQLTITYTHAVIFDMIDNCVNNILYEYIVIYYVYQVYINSD